MTLQCQRQDTPKPASQTGDVKTPKSKRSLVLPRRAVTALVAHRKLQVAERLAAGATWQDSNLVFCHEDGRMYTSDALNWRVSKCDETNRLRRRLPGRRRKRLRLRRSPSCVSIDLILET